ncbi:hypothetical protein [Flavobacterium hibernum]|uniref:Uncharacterized protein n=1 Tax=Flavobacterium hibernum TaxID=37752 RepID=A0A0D0F089_9FLAO|nr:hypothetical protein [Flavobacterium hibernum]KIO54703.1 hypothetical protein IW18_01490 [Flavobacterium hibernum]OXA85617.1 hypothetical protein B0A73_16530 [Flavobacterium hibernum]STO18458.1 Uncharacterised protein [Flavobacterium hibernum]
MDKKLKQYFIKSFLVLLLIHFGYFLYGYFTFEGIGKIDIYSEFYRFKFYDDVSISHFFISGLFLLFFLIFLIKNHSRQNYTFTNLLKIGGLLLLVSFFTFSFFVSYSFGMNAKLKTELSEKDLNNDKTLLNVLRPLLYNYTSYSSEKLFNPVNVLYPKPYPVIEVADSSAIGQYYTVEYKYYSIDTLKMLTTDLNKVSAAANTILDSIGFGKKELLERIIKKNTLKDSTEIIYKGQQVNPDYDSNICIFIKNKAIYKPIKGIPVEKQQYDAAVKRYNLLYKFKQDSLLHSFQKLDTLFRKYKIETSIVPKDLTKDVFFYKDHHDEPLNGIRNNFDRTALKDKLSTLERFFYEPNYLHSSIIDIFFSVIAAVWFVIFLIYILFNYKKNSSKVRTDS